VPCSAGQLVGVRDRFRCVLVMLPVSLERPERRPMAVPGPVEPGAILHHSRCVPLTDRAPGQGPTRHYGCEINGPLPWNNEASTTW
jgi:hypothetical protein